MWKENNPEKGFCKLKKKQHKKGPFLFSLVFESVEKLFCTGIWVLESG